MGLIHRQLIDRRGRRLTRAVTLAACALAGGVVAGGQGDGGLAPPVAPGGIWKAVVPAPGSMHGEFANHDPLGLAAGVAIPADCSINWVDPDAGKLYCFASATSLEVFLDGPHACLERARAGWLRLRPAQ
jgi:hypothetical protein